VNQQKIVVMTKLALYDKHRAANDRVASDYFRHDYIYKKNLGTRLAVGLGGVLILALYWLRVVLMDGIDIFTLDLQHHLQESILFVLAILAVYSFIGTIQGTREYYLMQKGIKEYQANLRHLERLEEHMRRPASAPAAVSSDVEPERQRPGERSGIRAGDTRRIRPIRDALVNEIDDDEIPANVRPRRRDDEAPLVRRERKDS